MSGRLFDRYGALLNEDVEVLDHALLSVIHDTDERTHVTVLEIGAHDGNTALGMRKLVESLDRRLDYYGIEPDTHRRDFTWGPDCHLIHADSAEAFHLVPQELDLVLVDGCHCFNHVALDTLHYAPRVRAGGFILYHDVNPRGQGLDHQYHGPSLPEFGLAVSAALSALRFPWPEWAFVDERVPSELNVHDCGMRAYRRVS